MSDGQFGPLHPVPSGGPPDLHVIQSLIRPEPGLCTETDLYVRRVGPVAIPDEGPVVVPPGSRIGTDTYFNLFAVGLWQSRCDLRDLRVSVGGRGRAEISIVLSRPERSRERLSTRLVTLEDDRPVTLDISPEMPPAGRGMLHVEITALSEVEIDAIDWQTAQPPVRRPGIVVSITTFRREDAVCRSVARFETFMRASPLRDCLRLQVVDNGCSAPIAPSRDVSYLENRNLGGAGGFARGLIEVQDSGATHCLFMDDDASIHMQSLERCWSFLAWARSERTAVAGAMINASHKWALWENGATFDGGCRPIGIGTDLRDPQEVADLVFDAQTPPPPTLYGGWWFFAFPVSQVKHMPFPFFVRGDDVSFSLAHDFDIVRLNGVVSFQEGFVGKESPLVWYLDMRSHLAHHLSLPHMDRGLKTLLRLPVWFYARNLIRLHYETLSAINLAVEDVLAGPEAFAADADMARRRADLAALLRQEEWRPAPQSPDPDRIRFDPQNAWARWAMKLSLNGHLIPFFHALGNTITLTPETRGSVRSVWGAARITVHDAEGARAYTVRHSKRAAARQGWRLARNLWRLARRRDALRRQWREGYGTLTTREYWSGALDLRAPRLADAEEEKRGGRHSAAGT